MWYMIYVWNEIMSFDMKYDSRYMSNTVYDWTNMIYYDTWYDIVFDVMYYMKWNDMICLKKYELRLHEMIWYEMIHDSECMLNTVYGKKKWYNIWITAYEVIYDIKRYDVIWNDKNGYEIYNIIWFIFIYVIFDRYVIHGVWHQIRYDGES